MTLRSFALMMFSILVFFSCKDKATDDPTETVDYSEETLNVTTSIYPENITKVFDAHGGLEQWKDMAALKFTMPGENGNEITSTNLYSRASLIEMPHHSIGFDGNKVWLQEKDTSSYKGEPKFYYNLMFYFYAMPFVMADDGIDYENVKPLEFEGMTYPGVKIAYESGVGESPKDEYILYYHPENFRMEWLAYTVTYFSKEKSEDWSFINYAEWQEVNGLLLPKNLVWYRVENNLPVEPKKERVFKDVELMREAFPESYFAMPEGAEVVE